MSDFAAGTGAGISRACQLPGDADPRLGVELPAEEYAVVQKLRLLPSAVVVADSGNLRRSVALPVEVFLDSNYLPSGSTMFASRENLANSGLDRLFAPDPGHCVSSIDLARSGTAWGQVLVKAPAGELPDTLAAIKGDCTGALDRLVSGLGDVALRYEWEILSHVGRPLNPCVVIDTDELVVAASAMMCDVLHRSAGEVTGCPLDDVVKMEADTVLEAPGGPEPRNVTTSVLLRPLFLFFTSEVIVTDFDTVCGPRTLIVFGDLYADRRTGNSNIQLIQKISGLTLLDGAPQNLIRKMLNLMALTLGCDLVCVLRRKQDREMIITPHSSRRVDMLRANVIEGPNEPLLEPFFARGAPVYCDNVEDSCPESSFFRKMSAVSRFVLVPVGDGSKSEYAVLATWSNPEVTFAAETVPLLKILANLLGTVLGKITLATENEQEKENLRRYTRLTAERETRMAALKRENAELTELVRRLSCRAEGKIA